SPVQRSRCWAYVPLARQHNRRMLHRKLNLFCRKLARFLYSPGYILLLWPNPPVVRTPLRAVSFLPAKSTAVPFSLSPSTKCLSPEAAAPVATSSTIPARPYSSPWTSAEASPTFSWTLHTVTRHKACCGHARP